MNGYKPVIYLEEAGEPYDLTFIDFARKEQKAPEYVKLNPKGRIPTIVDHSNNDFAGFESGAYGCRVAPGGPSRRWTTQGVEGVRDAD